MTAIQDPAAATNQDKTRMAYDVVAADCAGPLRGLMAGATWDRAVRAAKEKKKQPQAYALGVKPG